MRILMVESSPHKHGSFNDLAEHFMDGAEEAGHQVEIFDAARANLHPCPGCSGYVTVPIAKSSEFPENAHVLGKN